MDFVGKVCRRTWSSPLWFMLGAIVLYGGLAGREAASADPAISVQSTGQGSGTIAITVTGLSCAELPAYVSEGALRRVEQDLKTSANCDIGQSITAWKLSQAGNLSINPGHQPGGIMLSLPPDMSDLSHTLNGM